MASFSGTQTKCKTCSKTVYPMEQVIAEGVIFHKGCFRCSHCKNTLKLDNFVSLEGVFYCKPHYAQLFQSTGSLAKSFDEAIKTEKQNPPPPESITGDIAASRYATEKKEPSPIASKFGGTQEKCLDCGKTVYPLEKITVENNSYHKGCFRCVHGGCTLTSASFKTHSGKLYCKHHFNQLFLMKGGFSTMESEKVESSALERKPERALEEEFKKVEIEADEEEEEEKEEEEPEVKTPSKPAEVPEEGEGEEDEVEDDDDD